MLDDVGKLVQGGSSRASSNQPYHLEFQRQRRARQPPGSNSSNYDYIGRVHVTRDQPSIAHGLPCLATEMCMQEWILRGLV